VNRIQQKNNSTEVTMATKSYARDHFEDQCRDGIIKSFLLMMWLNPERSIWCAARASRFQINKSDQLYGMCITGHNEVKAI
jgi:hypothetical protein